MFVSGAAFFLIFLYFFLSCILGLFQLQATLLCSGGQAEDPTNERDGALGERCKRRHKSRLCVTPMPTHNCQLGKKLKPIGCMLGQVNDKKTVVKCKKIAPFMSYTRIKSIGRLTQNCDIGIGRGRPRGNK